MWKQIFNSGRQALAFAQKMRQYGSDIQELQEASIKRKEEQEFTTDTLRRVLYEFD